MTGFKVVCWPVDYLHLNPVNVAIGIYDFVLHNLVVSNGEDIEIKIESMVFQLFYEGRVVQTYLYSEKELEKRSRLSHLKINEMQSLESLFHLKKLLGKEPLSESLLMKPHTGIHLGKFYISSPFQPEKLKIDITGKTASQKTVNSIVEVEIRSHYSKNQYHFPLKDIWHVDASADLFCHHRWWVNTQFAYDFVKKNAQGKTFKGNGHRLTQNYSFGKEVRASLKGRVVKIENTIPESKNILIDDFESVALFIEKIKKSQTEILKKYGDEGPYGNYVLIQHDNEEYSFYAHLKQGSILVKVGDTVDTQQKIAAVGNSGNSTEPHLHFHVVDSPSFFTQKSIPFSFVDITPGFFDTLHYGEYLSSNRMT